MSGDWTLAVTSDSPARTRQLAAALAPHCRVGDVVLLIGDLGAGKTAFAQGFAAGLGVEGPVTSPTFALVRQYRCGASSPVSTLIHADIYRTESFDEVVDLALAELVEDDAVAVIEWGDLAAPAFGDNVLEIAIAVDDSEAEDDPPRTLQARGRGTWGGAGRGDWRGLAGDGHGIGMNIVGLETATETVGVAVHTADGLRAELSLTGQRRHVESLTPAIEHLLRQVGLEANQLEAIAVDLGPGLFTGLRVGVAAAKGLAQALGLGVIGLTSLEVLVHGAAAAGLRGQVAAVVDARRGEVFVALARIDHQGQVSEMGEPQLLSPDGLVSALRPLGDRTVVTVGDGARRYAEALAALPAVTVAGPALAWPPPAALVQLALDRLAAGQAPVAPDLVVPLYMRDADARRNFATVTRG